MNDITTANNPQFFKESLNKFDMLKEPKELNETLLGLPVGEVGLLIGSGGCGKSFFVQNLILASCGLTENHLVSKPLKVLYVSLEDNLNSIQRRLYANSIELDLNEEKLKNTELDFKVIENKSANRLITKGIKQEDNEFWQELNNIIKEEKYELVAIDTLIKTYTGYCENDNSEMSLVLSHFNTMAIENQCSILLLHHTNKSSQQNNGSLNSSSSRGASSLIDNSRWVNVLFKQENESSVICKSVKTNFSAPTEQEYYRGYKGALIMDGIEEVKDIDNAA